jgi:hypothetical protein
MENLLLKSRENPVIETLKRWNQYRENPVNKTGK